MDKKCPLEMYFKDGDCVRYKAPKTDVYWHASYCSRGKCLITDDLEVYDTLSTFAKHSLRKARPTRKTSEVNGWTKCEVQVDGKWFPAKTLRE